MPMSLQPQDIAPIPEETRRVAEAAFPKGNLYLRMRDQIGTIFNDPMFAPLFPIRGQPAESPWRLALIMVMQFVEGLSDRQAADAVRSRIDWKYALSLELSDPGFDASVLCEFRARLVDNGTGSVLLDAMLTRFKECGLLKAQGRQRTDSTHVLAAVRSVNRLELVGETLRAALNTLASVARTWLADLVSADWFDRYSTRVEQYKFPKSEAHRAALAETIGADGHLILAAAYAATAPAWLRQLPALQTLRIVWIQQFYIGNHMVRLRSIDDLPPAGIRLCSPYDVDAHYAKKRETSWSGYKVHVTETCDPDGPHLIINVETTSAPVADNAMTAPIHQALANRELSPATHLLDAGYVDAAIVISSLAEHNIDVVGPVLADTSWQAKAGEGFDISAFAIDWEAKQATCPRGQITSDWTIRRDSFDNECVDIRFDQASCAGCSQRSHCTRSKTRPREIMVRPQPQHELLQARRQQQKTAAWQLQCGNRAGIEGTLSQGVRAFGLRRCRYIGLAKTRLQHIITVLAMNVVRIDAWLIGCPLAKTRRSAFANVLG
jgi:transposase